MKSWGERRSNGTMHLMNNVTIAKLTLLWGLAFVFVYFGIDKFIHPNLWLGWMPVWMDNGFLGLSLNTWYYGVAIAEIVIAIMLVLPVRIIQKIGALLGILHLGAVLTQTGWNDIAVRDIGLVCMAVATWYLI